MNVSFIVPAYNEEDKLPQCLSSIHSCAKKLGLSYEIIVVNNNSHDNTVKIAESNQATVINQTIQSTSRTRNAGAKKAKYPNLIFIDADSLPTTKLINKALRELTKKEIKLVSTITRFETSYTTAKVAILLRNIFSIVFKLGAGQFIVIKRKTFNRIRGFSEEHLYFDEIQLTSTVKKTYGHKSVRILTVPILTSARNFQVSSNIRAFFFRLIAYLLGVRMVSRKSILRYKDLKLRHNERKLIDRLSSISLIIIAAIYIVGYTNSTVFEDLNQLLNTIVVIYALLPFIKYRNSVSIINFSILVFILEALTTRTGYPYGKYYYIISELKISMLNVPLYIPLMWLIFTGYIKAIAPSLRYIPLLIASTYSIFTFYLTDSSLKIYENVLFGSNKFLDIIMHTIIITTMSFILKDIKINIFYVSLNITIILIVLSMSVIFTNPFVSALTFALIVIINYLGINRSLKNGKK